MAKPRSVTEPRSVRLAEFDALYDDEFPAMVRLAFLITRSSAIAEEITNDAFTKAIEKWSSLASPGGYVRTLVVRAALRSRRRRGRERDHLASVQPATPPGEPDIDEMWDALGRLPVKQRAALVLRFYDDCSHEQIARAMHCTVSSARSLTHRGLAALRKDVDRWTRT
jgi:RNA polymerase sigma factor (sigma-70 family)